MHFDPYTFGSRTFPPQLLNIHAPDTTGQVIHGYGCSVHLFLPEKYKPASVFSNAGIVLSTRENGNDIIRVFVLRGCYVGQEKKAFIFWTGTYTLRVRN